MGRPTSLTQSLSAKLVALISEGLPLSKAADHEGISYRTLCRWMKREDEPYATFCHSIKKAKAQAQVDMIAAIRSGADNWQARAWYLERSDPKNWGRKDKLEVKKVDAPEKMTDEQLKARLRAALDQAGEKEQVH